MKTGDNTGAKTGAGVPSDFSSSLRQTKTNDKIGAGVGLANFNSFPSLAVLDQNLFFFLQHQNNTKFSNSTPLWVQKDIISSLQNYPLMTIHTLSHGACACRKVSNLLQKGSEGGERERHKMLKDLRLQPSHLMLNKVI